MNASRAFLIAAAAMGAGGVALLAAGSHAAPGTATIAGQMLLFHAPAIMASTLARDEGLLHSMTGRFALIGLVVGVAIFSADLALRGFGYGRLFPMAAPIGGSVTIISWVILAISAAMAPKREQQR